MRVEKNMNNLMQKNAVQEIMFDPLSYIHPARFRLSANLMQPSQRAVINDMLLRSYQLTTVDTTTMLIGGVALTMIKHWWRLPQIAFLFGCYRLRNALLRRGALLRLPAWARQFAEMPLCANTSLVNNSGFYIADIATELSVEMIYAQGLGEFLSWQAALPLWLRQRLSLQFAPQSEALLQTNTLQPPNLFLFTFAMQYAKNHPDPAFNLTR